MAEQTGIEWTDSTFNPWIGCTKVSQGCAHCYAEALMDGRMGKVRWGDGPDSSRHRTSAAYWKGPLKWDRAAAASGKRHLVFCASLADVFEDRDELFPWRVDLFALIAATPHLTWQLLTKRPENFRRFLPVKPPPNLWLGVSVENQETADARIPLLLTVGLHPNSRLFVSYEPALGPVNFWRILDFTGPDRFSLDWIIFGGESGHNRRPVNPEWFRDAIKQLSNRPYRRPALFMKQLDKVTPLPPDLAAIKEFPC